MSKPTPKSKQDPQTRKKRRAASEGTGQGEVRRLPAAPRGITFARCEALLRAQVARWLSEFLPFLGNGERPTGIRNSKHLVLQFARFVFGQEEAVIALGDPAAWKAALGGMTPAQQRIVHDLRRAETATAHRVAPGEVCPMCHSVRPPSTDAGVENAETPPPSVRPG
jgi:hypothetical protein